MILRFLHSILLNKKEIKTNKNTSGIEFTLAYYYI